MLNTFEGCTGLTSVTIGNSVTSIGGEAFSGCTGLTSVTIPNSVVTIGGSAFYSCIGLTSVTIPNSVVTIGGSAFYRCTGLTSVTIPNSVTSIGDRAFYGCTGLTSMTIPNSVASIGNNAFSGCCCLTSIIVNSGNSKYDSRDNCNAIIETSSNSLIAGCENTIIPNSVTSIRNDAFKGCTGLTSVNIPKGVTSIGNGAFDYCIGLTSVNIPEGVTYIGAYAFEGCTNLTSVNIPDGATIGYYAFGDCNSLTSVTVGMETPVKIDYYTFTNRANATLYVPAGSKAAYEVADYWKEFKEIVEIEQFTLEIQGEYDLTELKLYDENGNEYEKSDENQSTFELNEGSYVRIVPSYMPASMYIREIIVNGTSVGTWTDESTAPTEYVIENLTENTVVEFKRYLREQWRTLSCLAEGPGKVQMYKNDVLVSMAVDNDFCSAVFEYGDVMELVFVPDAGCTLTQFLGGDYGALEAMQENLFDEITDNSYNLTFNPDDIVDKFGYLVRCFSASFEGPEPSTANTLSATELTLLTGQTAALSIGLTNEDEIIMTEFYMELPEGITIEEDEDGYPIVTLNSERDNKHVLEVSRNSNGDYHLLCYSSNNNAFKGNEGELFTMNLVCADGVTAGTYQATVKNIIMSDIGRNELIQSDFTFDITVMDVAMGDANGDGRINGMDIVEMVDYIMERPSDGFIFVAADITGDGKVNGMDLVELVSLVMAQGAASPQPSPKGKGAQMAASIDSGLKLTSGDGGELKLGVEMPGEFILAQMIVEVGNGRLTEVTTDTKHEAVWSEIGAGRYSVLAYSAKNRSFTANDCLLTFYGNAENISVKDVMLVDANRDAKYFADVAYNGTTGIERLTPDSGITGERSVYSISGQRVSVSSVLPKGVYIVNGKKVIVK